MYLSTIVFLVLWFGSGARAWAGQEFRCDDSQWRRPAESENGVFLGDLELKCTLALASETADFMALETAIREKLLKESKVYEAHDQITLDGLQGRSWDVGREILDGGNAVRLREKAFLATDGSSRLIYKTLSKEVEGEGMASYLRSVAFEAHFSRVGPASIEMRLANVVRVERPWYALDLMFASIARGVCRDKMKVIRDQLVPWFRAGLLR